MDINELLSGCSNNDEIDLKVLTSILFTKEEQTKIREHIKATS